MLKTRLSRLCYASFSYETVEENLDNVIYLPKDYPSVSFTS